MRKDFEHGFTLIELVVVMVIIGILAIVAIPKFIDVSKEAHQAIVAGTAAAFETGIEQANAVWLVRLEQETPQYDGVYGAGKGLVNFNSKGFIVDASDSDISKGLDTINVPNANRCGRIWNRILNYQPSLDNSGYPNPNGSKVYTAVEGGGTFIVTYPTTLQPGNGNCQYSLMADPSLAIVYNSITGEVRLKGF